jgi:hypothetical protein
MNCIDMSGSIFSANPGSNLSTNQQTVTKKYVGLSGILADIKVNERLLDGISPVVI